MKPYERKTLDAQATDSNDARMISVEWPLGCGQSQLLTHYNWDRSFVFFILTDRGAVMGRVPRADISAIEEQFDIFEEFYQRFSKPYLALWRHHFDKLKGGGSIRLVPVLPIWVEEYGAKFLERVKWDLRHWMVKEDNELGQILLQRSEFTLEDGLAAPPDMEQRDSLSARMACAISFTIDRNKDSAASRAALQTWFGTDATLATKMTKIAFRNFRDERYYAAAPGLTWNLKSDGVSPWGLMSSAKPEFNPFIENLDYQFNP